MPALREKGKPVSYMRKQLSRTREWRFFISEPGEPGELCKAPNVENVEI